MRVLVLTIVLALLGAFFVPQSAVANTRTCFDKHTGYTYKAGGSYFQYASHYGEGFQGKTTASMKVFNRYDPTMAAHKVLPIGTEFVAESLINGAKVRGVVYDDGPHPQGRDLDASDAMGAKLGIIEPGTGWVKVTILKLGDQECRDDGKGLR